MPADPPKILHLTLKQEWFDLIASGKKLVEFREVKPYWVRRLQPGTHFKHFDFIRFRNGYRPGCPEMLVVFRGIGHCMYRGSPHFGISLGRVVEIKNWSSLL